MTCWPVSTRVGNVKNNEPSLIEPVAAQSGPLLTRNWRQPEPLRKEQPCWWKLRWSQNGGRMWSMIPAIVIVLSQTAQAAPASKSGKWCFDRGQNAQLCEDTEDACNKLREINTEIVRSPCKPPETQVSPNEPPAPPNPERQAPTQQ
jgi:hypothetical protein